MEIYVTEYPACLNIDGDNDERRAPEKKNNKQGGYH